MFDSDDADDLRRRFERAKRDPALSSSLKMQLEEQVKKSEKQKLAKLDHEIARKELRGKQKKLKDEMGKQGIQNVDTKPDPRQLIDAAKRTADAQRAQGQTEEPTKTA